MGRIIAYCGMVCTDCAEFTATQANDRTALEQIAARYRKELDKPDITAEYLLCDGCLTDRGRLAAHCANCRVRACGMARGIANCAHRPEYVCERLQGFWDHRPDVRKGYRVVLDEIRRSL